MRIYNRITIDMATGLVEDCDFYEYHGPLLLCCGATPAQTQAEAGQGALFSQMTSQAQQVFGASSQVFNQLQKTFAPIVAAGPSQQGFSPAEASNLKSAAITNTGQSYANAKAAAGNAEASVGGGNNPALTGGSDATINTGVATAAASQTAGELNQINEQNYATGRDNYNNAVKGLEGSTDVFNPATSAGSAATGAGSAFSTTANQIASQDNSWMGVVTGALGGVAGAATGGLTKSIGSGSSGGSSSNGSGDAGWEDGGI